MVRWPAGIPASAAGGLRSQFCHAVDVAATVLDVAGATMPEQVGGHDQLPLHGASIRPTFDAPEALISVYRVPGSTACGGLIRAASDWLAGQRPEVRRIIAEVLPDNAASLAAFHAAGYRDSRHTLVLELETP